MSQLIETYKQRAKALGKTIVLPEGEEPRVIKAAGSLAEEGFAKIILWGKESVIKEKGDYIIYIVSPNAQSVANAFTDVL